jgi:hypothetical protein
VSPRFTVGEGVARTNGAAIGLDTAEPDGSVFGGGRDGGGHGPDRLHVEQAREIGGQLDGHGGGAPFGRRVVQAEIAPQTPTDPVVTEDEEAVVLGAPDEGRVERLVTSGRQALDALVVHRHHEPRADPRITDEDAVDAVLDVASRPADQEAAALHQRDRGSGGRGQAAGFQVHTDHDASLAGAPTESPSYHAQSPATAVSAGRPRVATAS